MVRCHLEWSASGCRVPAGLALAVVTLAVLSACAGEPRRPVRVTIQDEQPQVDLVDLPIDRTPRIRYQFGQHMRVGFMVETPQGFQNLTCGQDGSTNNTHCMIDGQDLEFGAPNGRFEPQQAPLNQEPGARKREGTKSTWIYNNLHITQVVEIVPTKAPPRQAGAPARRQCDACVIRYLIENKDTRPHTVGLRNMIDVLVAGNDGAQFAVPDKQGFRLVPGGDFRTAKEVPAVVQALQQPDLNNPGVVAYISTRVGGRLEPPGRLVLTRWPGSACGWEVPVQQAVADTAYAVYWFPQELRPGAKREVGFGYGKGVVSSLEDEGRVAVALGGSFEPGKIFTVTAYVEGPVDGQSLTLELPPGMAAVEGAEIQPVPAPTAGGLSMVLWKATTQKTGRFPLRVRSSTGVTQTKNITITP